MCLFCLVGADAIAKEKQLERETRKLEKDAIAKEKQLERKANCQEKWLARYNELIEYKKHNRSAAFMCGGKLGAWVQTSRKITSSSTKESIILLI